jgi:hypothetical protein
MHLIFCTLIIILLPAFNVTATNNSPVISPTHNTSRSPSNSPISPINFDIVHEIAQMSESRANELRHSLHYVSSPSREHIQQRQARFNKSMNDASNYTEPLAQEEFITRQNDMILNPQFMQQLIKNTGDIDTQIQNADINQLVNIMLKSERKTNDLLTKLSNQNNTGQDGNNNHTVLGGVYSNVREKRSVGNSQLIETKDQSTSTEDLAVLKDRLFDDKLEHWEFAEEEAFGQLNEVISSYSDSDDTNSVISEEALQSKPIVSETVQDELADIEQELQSQVLREEEVVEEILSEGLMTDTLEGADINNSTARHQEKLAKIARLAARERDDLRFGSKAVNKQIRHRLLTRDIGSMIAVSAGEEEDKTPSYSVWSSGMFGAARQKDSSTILGYSSSMRGSSVGAEINFSNDLMFGVSYSRLASNVKYLTILNSDSTIGKFVKSNMDILSIYSGATLGENINLHSLSSIALSQNSKDKNILKPKSKLFSFELHLNYKLALEDNITLIPSLGFRYEYGRISFARGQVVESYIMHHLRSRISALSGELGAKVLFTPIKLSSDFTLTPIAHISLEKSIGGSESKSGQLLSIKDIGVENSLVINNSHQGQLSTNIGGGIIASHKNINFEFVLDMQKPRRFKSHQGILTLKVNL